MIVATNLARTMKNRVTQRNGIFEKVQNGELSPPSHRKKIEDIDFEFPKTSLNELRPSFIETHQIKQTGTYVEECFHIDSAFIVEIGNSIDDFVHCSIRS